MAKNRVVFYRVADREYVGQLTRAAQGAHPDVPEDGVYVEESVNRLLATIPTAPQADGSRELDSSALVVVHPPMDTLSDVEQQILERMQRIGIELVQTEDPFRPDADTVSASAWVATGTYGPTASPVEASAATDADPLQQVFGDLPGLFSGDDPVPAAPPLPSDDRDADLDAPDLPPLMAPDEIGDGTTLGGVGDDEPRDRLPTIHVVSGAATGSGGGSADVEPEPEPEPELELEWSDDGADANPQSVSADFWNAFGGDTDHSSAEEQSRGGLLLADSSEVAAVPADAVSRAEPTVEVPPLPSVPTDSPASESQAPRRIAASETSISSAAADFEALVSMQIQRAEAEAKSAAPTPQPKLEQPDVMVVGPRPFVFPAPEVGGAPSESRPTPAIDTQAGYDMPPLVTLPHSPTEAPAVTVAGPFPDVVPDVAPRVPDNTPFATANPSVAPPAVGPVFEGVDLALPPAPAISIPASSQAVDQSPRAVQLLSRPGSRKGTSVLVTGSHGGSGKTTIAWLLPFVLAYVSRDNERGRNVYLVEADYSNPKLAQRYDLPADKNSARFASFVRRLGSGGQQMSKEQVIQETNEVIDSITHHARLGDSGRALRVIACPYDTTTRDTNQLRDAIQKLVTTLLTREDCIVFIDGQTFMKDDVLDSTLAATADAVLLVGNGRHEEDAQSFLHTLSTPAEANGGGVDRTRLSVFLNETSHERATELARAFSPVGVVGYLPSLTSIDDSTDAKSVAWVGQALTGDDLADAVTFIARTLLNLIPVDEETRAQLMAVADRPLRQKYGDDRHRAGAKRKTGIFARRK